MIIRTAQSLGMCFGVRDALRAAAQLPNPQQVAIRGQLVHNEEILRQLDRRGFQQYPEGDSASIPDAPKVLITAHGVSDKERARLLAAGKELIDATCPLVRRIHHIALRLHDAGCLVIVIGRRSHVEVQGLIGDLERFEVIETPKEARRYDAPRLGVVCQSTAPPDLADAVVERLRWLNPDSELRYIPTICHATLERQESVRALLGSVEALVVVGGRNSNNTRELVALADSYPLPVLHIQSSDELDPEWFTPFQIIGLTAGTSTPDWTIREVYQRLLAIDPPSPSPSPSPSLSPLEAARG